MKTSASKYLGRLSLTFFFPENETPDIFIQIKEIIIPYDTNNFIRLFEDIKLLCNKDK